MLSSKKKRNVFKQCVHELRTSGKIDDYPGIEDFYKDNRDKIIAFTDDMPAAKNPVEAYGQRLREILDFIYMSILKFGLEPMEEERREIMDRVLANINNLRSEIETGIIDLDKIEAAHRFQEWGGADVIISSDPDRTGYDSDLVIHTKHASLIAWLMTRLSNIAAGTVTWQNKYEFYWRIAECARQRLMTDGETNEFRKELLIGLLDEAASLVKSWR